MTYLEVEIFLHATNVSRAVASSVDSEEEPDYGEVQEQGEVQLDQDAPLWSFSLWHDKKTGKSLLVYIKQLSGTEGNHLLVYKAAAWRQMACT